MECMSCGTAEAHPLAIVQGKMMCRYCTEKTGNMWVFHRMIDLEKLQSVSFRAGQTLSPDDFMALVNEIAE